MDIDRPKRATPHAVDKVRRLLIIADDTVHIIVAVFLVAAALVVLGYAANNFIDLTVASTLLVINDVLFVLIIAELLWTIIRYLRREQFSLAPFLFIGIISSLRRILYIDAQMSLGTGERSFNENLMELGTHVGIIFVLVVAYFLIKKAQAVDD
jgi:uncharacterized membrane protein (DUF373 family)